MILIKKTIVRRRSLIGQMDFYEAVDFTDIVLHSSLTLVAVYFCFSVNRFTRLFSSDHEIAPTSHQTNNIYIQPKNWFFGVMAVASMCSILPDISCLDYYFKGDCMFDDGTIDFTFEIITTIVSGVGYVYTVIVPCILWNDALTLKDGKLFYSKYPPDRMKTFYRFVLISEIIASVGIVIAFIIIYVNYNIGIMLVEICRLIVAILSAGICIACCISALQISALVNRLYPTNVPFSRNSSVCNQPLFWRLLFPMFIIMISYMGRALVLLIGLVWEDYPFDEKWYYLCWILFSEWMPNVVCSFVLIDVVRRIGKRTIDEISEDGESEDGILLHHHDEELLSDRQF